MKTTETHKFKRGQKLHLDEIYDIQGLAGGTWWSAHDGTDDEDVTITENITITITVVREDNVKEHAPALATPHAETGGDK